MSDRRVIVVEPGLLTTVQDLGRSGLLRFGVTSGGALDQAALILGNRLVGSEPEAAGLEITLIGPRLQFASEVVLALTGADLDAKLNGQPVPMWQPFLVKSGDELSFAPGGAAGGARAYLCLAGGITVPPVMGGRGTDLFAHFGGLDGRALRGGDQLPLGDVSDRPEALLRRRLAAPPPVLTTGEPIRVVLGPQADRFTEAAIAVLLSEPYTVSAKADRMGLRLNGPRLEHVAGADLISEGIHQGSIQVPGDGLPIALTRARQTVGGYPKIATVIGADLDQLGQRRPGDPMRFAAVEVEAARRLTLAYRATLGPDAVVDEPVPSAGWTAPVEAERVSVEHAGEQSNWTPEAVIRLIAELQAADIGYFKLEIESVGLRLELRREPAGVGMAFDSAIVPASESGAGPASDSAGVEVVAPMLGVFYRRPAPDQPPYADTGQAIEAGQAIGLIEVMKTYHEVTAPQGGVLTELLVEDGQFVEYGQVIARLR
jgi:antagonist of KipI